MRFTSRPLFALCAAVFAIAALAPIAMMLARIEAADWEVLADPRIVPLLFRTAWMGLGAASIAFAIGVPLGLLNSRTNMPMSGALRWLSMVPLFLPPVILATASAVLLENLRGAGATVLVLGVSTFPIPMVFTARALERVDARREDAANLVGGLRAVLRMELPLAMPAALCGACFAFAIAINDYAVPDYIASVGPKYNVYADEVFSSWQSVHRPGRAVASALPLAALSLAALIPALALRRRDKSPNFDGEFRRPRPLELGIWRWPSFAFAVAIVALSSFVPLGRLIWEAGDGRHGWSFEHLTGAFAHALDVGRSDLANSLTFALAAALISIPLALVLGHAFERAKHSAWFETATILPLALPAILFGIGYIALWNHESTALFYDSGWIVIALFVGRFAALPILAAGGASAMLDPRLEEAALLSGAGPIARTIEVVAPPLAPSLAGGATLVYVFAMRELDAAMLVPAANGTAMFRVYNALHFGRDDFVAALALTVVFFILLPGILWALFAQKRAAETFS